MSGLLDSELALHCDALSSFLWIRLGLAAARATLLRLGLASLQLLAQLSGVSFCSLPSLSIFRVLLQYLSPTGVHCGLLLHASKTGGVILVQ